MARTTKSDQVRELQRTLYRAAKADPKRRFHALHDKVYRSDVLERAWESVRANHGAAGIDQTTIADVEQYGVSRLLDELAADLGDGRWRPLPARRVFIPKPGKGELRPLSIPTVRDRVVQAALKSVIEPIFEADMLECSFGFSFCARFAGSRGRVKMGDHLWVARDAVPRLGACEPEFSLACGSPRSSGLLL
jgi:RNA-directed DNA polymerase